ncbi:hypothetical protein HK096_010213, partial [Nowakowskiella sp. JEL0078]
MTTVLLAVQSTGVIFGDIGTSPLYVYSSTFSTPPAREDLLGALSLIIWTLTLLVTVKYVVFVLSADDHGEGGTLALYSLLSRHMDVSWKDPTQFFGLNQYRTPTGTLNESGRQVRKFFESFNISKRLLLALSTFGICMVIADGFLTPAQSVLGSIQGLQVPFPEISQMSIAVITSVILFLLFLIQPFGTTKIGYAFAPIIIIWLLFNFVIGIYNLILYDSSVLSAFSPYWIYSFFNRNHGDGFVKLGGILLSFTGVEALFADVGHFSPAAVRLSWCLFAYPCLLLAYIGQAAYISVNLSAFSNPFFACVPSVLFWPSFILAILATIVASQAMIS